MAADATVANQHEQRTVTARRIAFPHDPAMRKHFFADDLVMSHVLAVLSATFPQGEDFFVHSVRSVRAEVSDEALRSRMAGFIGQEAMHGREHDRLNHHLAKLGYPTGAIDRAVGVFVGVIERVAPASVQLAATAALEHYTAVLAEQLLADDAFGAYEVPEELRALFRWHALEECEHKAVAFDVFEDRFDSEGTRILTMQVATALLVGLATPLLVASIATDRAARNPIRLVRSVLNLRRSPFARRSIARNLLQYSRPGFHPDERDTTAVLERWRTELFGDDGSLTAYLSQAANAPVGPAR
jgi:predicted metal-dependent hydrolase